MLYIPYYKKLQTGVKENGKKIKKISRKTKKTAKKVSKANNDYDRTYGDCA